MAKKGPFSKEELKALENKKGGAHRNGNFRCSMQGCPGHSSRDILCIKLGK